MADPHSPYDAVPYESRVIPQTSPRHLALTSAWHGGPLPPVAEYRALEVGCGEGTNLIALAFYQPESSFVGMDSSGGAIARARGTAEALGIANVRFEVRDVREPLVGSEPFHYILAHGLFSWIPEDARAALLGLIRDRLTPDGLGFLSYNAQPGWTARGMVRDVLLRARTVREAELQDRAARAAEVAEALLADLPSPRSAYGSLLALELEKVVASEPWYLVHEYLTEVNDPFWHRDFAGLLGDAGLRGLADAQFCRAEGQVPPEVSRAVVKRRLDREEREEVIDLLCNRRMRMPVVCRAGAKGCGSSRLDLLQGSHLAASLSVTSGPARLMDGDTEEFEGPRGESVQVSSAIVKAAARALNAEWPCGLTLAEVSSRALGLLKTCGILVPGYASGGLGDKLLGLVASGHVEMRLQEPTYEVCVPERPAAHALARWESARSGTLTTPHHASWAFGRESLDLLATLDGSRTLEEIAREPGRDAARQTVETAARYGLLAAG